MKQNKEFLVIMKRNKKKNHAAWLNKTQLSSKIEKYIKDNGR